MRRTRMRWLATSAVVAGLLALAPVVPAASVLGGGPVASTGGARELSPAGVYVLRLADDRPADAPVGPLADAVARVLGATLTHVYDEVFDGFAAALPPGAADALRALPAFRSVRADVAVRAADAHGDPSWGLDRIDQRELPLDGRFLHPEAAGDGAHVYVVDSGVDARHEDFSGRIGESRNFVASGLLGLGGVDPAAWSDCDGHGTHVAGVAAGEVWGVAKAATIHAVRVLDCRGVGTTASVLAGLDWVAGHAGPGSVANLSFGTSRSVPDLDAAVAALVEADVAVAVAAMNADSDACAYSPAAVPEALTVGATDITDTRAAFSNHGACLDLFAPGVDIRSAARGGRDGSRTLSGTSMAAPYVAGVLAVLRAARADLDAREVQQEVLTAATPGRIADAGGGSPNRLLFAGVVDPGTSAPPVTGDPADPASAASPPCAACSVAVGTLERGDVAHVPDSGGFRAEGRVRGHLRAQDGASFDLVLQRRTCALLVVSCEWAVHVRGVAPQGRSTGVGNGTRAVDVEVPRGTHSTRTACDACVRAPARSPTALRCRGSASESRRGS